MGTKFTKALCMEHVAASPRAAPSHGDKQHREPKENAPIATSAATLEATLAPPASTAEHSAMDIPQRPHMSTHPRPPAMLPHLRRRPSGGAVEDEPLSLPQPPPPPPAPRQTRSCLVCCVNCDGPDENSPKSVTPCRYGHAFCVPCLKNTFLEACKDITRMPPRCCHQLSLHHVRPYLTEDAASLFKAKYEEWGTTNPFYCPVAPCSAFIPDRLLPPALTSIKGKQRVDSGIGTPTAPTVNCPKCDVSICTKCRGLAHAEGTCSPLEFGIDKETAELLKQWGYKRCPKCGNGLKRMFGCNHMECRCGAHFCWVCLKGRDSCIDGCVDEEDEDEDESYFEPDEEEDEDEPQRDTQTTPTQDSTPVARSTEEHADAPTASPEQPPENMFIGLNEPSTTPPTAPPSPKRVRNLDGGSGRYWEETCLYFGDEPTDEYQDRAWDCHHDFYTAKIKLAEAFTKHSPHSGMECMKCWATVHPEVEMPPSIRSRHRTTTVVASANRRLRTLSRIRTGCLQGPARHVSNTKVLLALRPSRSTERLTAAEPQPNTFSASFSGPLHAPGTPAHEQPFATPHSDLEERVVDLYGNTVTTGNYADEEMPDWVLSEQKSKDGRAGLTFATDSTPFSFAYECDLCGLLVCQRCRDNLGAAAEVHVHDGEH